MYAVAAAAACDAESQFNPSYGVTLAAYVHSRVLSRALTRYRQEWTFSNRYGSDILEERDGDACWRSEGFLIPVVDGMEGNPACIALLEAVVDLPEESRWLIEQLFWEGRTEAEIARGVGISQQAIAKRKRSVLRVLHDRLQTAQKSIPGAVVKGGPQRNP